MMICFSFSLQMLTDGLVWCGLLWCFYQTLILTAPIHCRASIDSHSDGTHSLQSIHWLSFWRHPFTAEHPLTLILTAPIHCRASIDSHSDGTHSLQRIHCWASDTFLQIWWRHKLIYVLDDLSFPFMVVFLERCGWERSEGGAKQAVWTKLIKWSLIQTFPGHQLRGIKEESEKARGVRDEARERSGRLN